MIKNYISVLVLAFICAMSISHISAQEKVEKYKVVVVEKTIDANGNEIEKKIVKDGDEAKALIEKMESEEKNTWTNDDGETIDLDGKNYKVLKKEAYKMKIIDEDGNEEILEWDGEGEMPQEIKEALEKENIDINEFRAHKKIAQNNNVQDINVEVEVDAEGTEKKHIKIELEEDGKKELIEFEMEGEEIPADIQKILDERGIELKIRDEGKTEKKIIIQKGGQANSNKPQLGVMIENDPKGVLVNEIVKDSSAAKAEMKEGDVITAIDNKKLKTTRELIALIGAAKVGDVINVDFLRDGKAMSKKIELQKRVELFEFKTWDEVMKKKK